jgi:hypothetical protein
MLTISPTSRLTTPFDPNPMFALTTTVVEDSLDFTISNDTDKVSIPMDPSLRPRPTMSLHRLLELNQGFKNVPILAVSSNASL